MKKEVELQLVIKDPAEVEKEIRKVGKFIGIREQTDRYFVPPYKDFLAKDPPIEYLRIRYEKDNNHLNYSFLHFDENGWLMVTDEYETLIENPEIVEEIFKKIGLILKITVVKTRKVFDCGDLEVTLDNIKDLGDFMEIEAKKDFGNVKKTREACLKFLKGLDIKYERRRAMGYPRMLYQKLNEQPKHGSRD